MRFTIAGRLAGANETTLKDRSHWSQGAKLRSAEIRRCAIAAAMAKVPVFSNPVMISFFWYEPNRRRDMDNIRYGAKYIIDGMRAAGILSNDGWGQIRLLTDTFFCDPKNPRIEVEIRE